MNSADIVKKPGGFTLLELVLAIFIFAIVVSALYGAYIETISIADTTESQAENGNKARTALERITADLGSMYLEKGALFRCRKQEIQGNRLDTIEFSSTAHIDFAKKNQPGIFTVIEYRVQPDSDTQLLQLYRIDRPFRPGDTEQNVEEEKGFLLCDGLRAVRFRFFDRNGTEVDDWQNTPQAGQELEKGLHLPAMIEIELTFNAPHEENGLLVFKTAAALPVMTQSESK